MRYQRTQVYLDPEEHRRLLAEAAERGISLAEHLRRIVAARAGEASPSYGSRSFGGITNLFSSGPKDTVEHMDEEAGLAFDEKVRKGSAATPRTRSKKNAGR